MGEIMRRVAGQAYFSAVRSFVSSLLFPSLFQFHFFRFFSSSFFRVLSPDFYSVCAFFG
jgi:hypothetical protein